MFVAISTYLKSAEEVSAVAPLHNEWTTRHYAAGRILGSGRLVPPTGGVIIARAESREAFLTWLAEDPFVQHGVSHYEVYEFTPGPLPRRAPELETFLTKPLLAE
jgi:uncharacterized protein YciI